ncbi:MAG: hypothetical protein R2853_01750 [Thermomicrobiales bacterium]
MPHVVAPALGEARANRQEVGGASGNEQTAHPHRASIGQRDLNALACFVPAQPCDESGDHPAGVLQDLGLAQRIQVRQRRAFARQEVVDAAGQGFARRSGVDDQYAAPAACQRDRSGQARRVAASHHDVNVRLHAPSLQ